MTDAGESRPGRGRHGRRSAPRSVSDAARVALGRIDRGGGMARARAVSAWSEAAGPEVAAHAMGFAMREGELVVFVDTPVWATELAALSEMYRTAVNGKAGEELVRSVRFTVSRHVEKERTARAAQDEIDASYVIDRVEPVAATATERAQLEQMAAVIRDEELRDDVVRAALRGLEWKKGLAASDPERAD